MLISSISKKIIPSVYKNTSFCGTPQNTTSIKTDTVELSHRKKPNNIGQIYEKTKDPITGQIHKKKIDINIERKKQYDQTIYTFKNGNEIVGYLQLEEHLNIPEYNKAFLMCSDIPEFGIVGDRIIIKYVVNNNQEKYSGIGKLSDKIAVEHCHKLGIKPIIVLQAAYNSHAAHYKRGMRYIYSDSNNNPNEIIKNIIEKTPRGEKCQTSDLYSMVAYMPPETVAKYEEELKNNPIIN